MNTCIGDTCTIFFSKKGGVALSYYDTLLHIALADIVITEPIMWQYTIVAMKN